MIILFLPFILVKWPKAEPELPGRIPAKSLVSAIKSGDSVVLFSNSSDFYENFKFHPEIIGLNTKYLISDESGLSSRYCFFYPCLSAFSNGSHIRSMPAEMTYTEFVFFLRHTFGDKSKKVTNPEDLRRRFSLPGAFAFGTSPCDVPYASISAPKWVLDFLNLSASGAYRPADHFLSKYQKIETKSNFIEIGADDISNKPFLAVFEAKGVPYEEFSPVLAEVAKAHSKAFNFAIVSESSRQSPFYHFCSPLLVVFNSSNMSTRWALTNVESLINAKELSSFLDGVQNGKIDAAPISAEIVNETGSLKTLVNADFYDKVIGPNKPALILVTSSCIDTASVWFGLITVFANKFKESGVGSFIYDQGFNDFNELVPQFDEYPKFILWSQGKMFVYSGEPKLPDLLYFIRKYSGSKIEVSDEELSMASGDVVLMSSILDQQKNQFAGTGAEDAAYEDNKEGSEAIL